MKFCPLASLAWLLFTTTALAEALPRSTPEEQGISSQALVDFITAADKQIDTMNSVMLIRHGHVVTEGWWAPYQPTDRHMLYSLSKSFTSTAIGMAVAEGKLNLDDTVISFFTQESPKEPSDNLKAMRIRDLLTMSTGHTHEEISKLSFARKEVTIDDFLALPVSHKPGTHFLYNTPATFTCSAILQKVTGEKLVDYLASRLFEPLGIADPLWQESKEGISYGGFGLNIKTDDIAKFGQLYLQKGNWQGKQLVADSWIDQATSRQVSNGSNPDSDWEQGYGYQFWMCRPGFYRADGACGQYCIVMPEYDAVLVITSGVRDMGAVMQLAWDKLLPAMQSQALPPNEAAHEELTKLSKNLQVAMPQGTTQSLRTAAGLQKTLRILGNKPPLESIGVEFGPNGDTLILRNERGEDRIACGRGEWLRGETICLQGPGGQVPHDGPQGIAASGAWQDDDTYRVRLCLFETPFYLDVTMHFVGEEVVVTDSIYNCALGGEEQRELPQMIGHSPAQ
jgi:CubicO group peptidase (beta-lactamase class C family)